MRNIIIVLIFLNLLSCTSLLNFDKAYYEKVTKIKLPHNYKIVATADNGEFVTITILDFDKASCKKLISDYHFERWNKNHSPSFEGLYFLDSIYKMLPDTKSYLVKFKDKVPGKTGWIYAIDTLTCRLYCEIEYPDMAGN